MSKLKEQIDKNRASRTETTSSGGKSLLKQQIDAQRSGTTYQPNQSEVGRRVLNGQKTAASDTRKELFVTGSRNIKHQRAEYQKRAAKKQSPSPVLPASASQNTAQQRSGKSRGAYDSSLRDRLTQQRTREPATRTNQEQYDWVGQRAVRKKADRKDSGMDGWKLLEGMAVQGATGFAESAASTLDLIERQLLNAQEVFMPTGGERVAQGGPFRALHEGIKKEQEDARAVYQPNVEKGGTAAEVADFLGTTTFEAIPQGAVATISAGAKATQAGVNVLNRAAELTPGLWRSIRTAAKGAMENPAFWSSFLQTVGSDYDESIANGASEGQALTMAVTNGLLNAGIEVGGGLETMDATKTFGVKDLVKSAVEEGNEEVAQGITQRGLQNLIYQNGNPMFSTTDENAVLNPWTAAQEWGGGAFAGGVLSGASAGTNALMRARYNQQLAELGAVYQADPGALVERGLSFAPETRAHQTAAQMQEKANAGQALTDADLGEMVAANEQTMQQQRQLERANAPAQEREADTQSADTARAQADYDAALRAAREAAQERDVNRQRVRRAADSFGENGAKALRTTYDGSRDAAAYYAGFAAYYQAGISGADMAAVDRDYSGSLTQSQRFAAWSAGQNDAALSLKREQQAAKFAPVAGADSGLVYDDFVRDAVESGRTQEDVNGEERVYLTAETAERVNTVAKALGLRAQFVDSVAGGKANAQISGDTVLLERDNPNPVLFLMGHEAAHRMQQLAPTEYRAFRDIAVAEYGPEIVQRRIDDYAVQGVSLTWEGAMDEVAADKAGQLMDGGAVLDEFIRAHRENKPLLEKLRDAIRSFLAKLTGREKKKAQTAQGKLTAALEAAAKEAKTLQGQSDNGKMAAKYSLKDLTEEENTALTNYKSSESYKVNAKLRGEGELTPQDKVYVRHMDSALTKMPTHTGQVYRNITFDGMGDKAAFDAFMAEHEEGALVAYPAYTSTSTDVNGYPLEGRYVVHMVIEGHSGRNMTGVGNNFESEVLFERQNCFGISKVSRNEDGSVTIYMTEVSANEEADPGGNGSSENDSSGMPRRTETGHSDEKRSQTVQQMQEAGELHGDLSAVSEADSLRSSDGRGLPEIRGEGEAKHSLKTGTLTKSYSAILEENRLLREQTKDYLALRRRNRALEASRDYWQGQTRRSQQVTTDRKAVEKAAKALVKRYGAELSAEEVQGIQSKLQRLYDYMASGREGKDELTYSEARRRAEEIGRALVEHAAEEDDAFYRQYSDLRQYMKDTRLVVTDRVKGGIADFGAFRKENLGRMRLVNGKETNIDQVYQELSERWPEFFDETMQVTPTDQLLQMSQVLQEIGTITEYNPYSADLEQAAAGAANEIMEGFFDLPQTKKTFADRAALRLEDAKGRDRQRLQKAREQNRVRLAELREQNRERVQSAIARERETRQRQLERLRDKYRSREETGRERRSQRELRAKIIRHAGALSRKLLRPTDQQHIPEALRGPVAAMLGSINLESAYTLDGGGKRVKDGSGKPTKRSAAFLALRDQYAHIAAQGGEGLVIDPALLGDAAEDIQGGFDAVIALGDRKLADLNTGELETIWKVLRAVEWSISTANRNLAQEKYARTQDWAAALSRDTAGKKPRKGMNLSISLKTPYTFFAQYGQAGRDIYRMLRDAQDRQQVMLDQVTRAARAIADPKTVQRLEKEHRTYSLESGLSLTLTRAQAMEVYLLSRRKQALEHLLAGGVVQPKVESAKVERGTDSLALTEQDVNAIVGSLTDEEGKIADGLQRLTGGMLAEFGNEASRKAYGYRKFTEENYWPIKTAREGRHSSVDKSEGNARAIKNIGLAKAVTPHAKNAVDLSGAFTTFADHAGDMVDYAAWLCPMEDANRLFNFAFARTERGADQGSTVKGLLNRVGGEGAEGYWQKLMTDIQNGINDQEFEPMSRRLVPRLVGNFKGAAVGGNIRVVIQQPTAFFRAAAVLDPGDMAKGLVKGVTAGDGWKKALEWSPIAMRKDAGGFDISAPAQVKQAMFDGRSWDRRLNDALSAPAGAADAVTWGRLWNACEWTVQRERPGLEAGSEGFYRETAKQFAEAIDQTQVVDGVLQRSNIMRARSDTAKQATSFMGEPIMSLNLLMRTWDGLRMETDPKRRTRAIRTLGRAATALLVTNLVNAMAQSIIDAMRDDDEDKKYWQRFWVAFVGQDGTEETILDRFAHFAAGSNVADNLNPVTQVPYAKDVLSMLQGYHVTRTDTEVLGDVADAAKLFVKSADGQDQKTRIYAVKSLAAATAKLFGLPVANLTRDIWAGVRSLAVETGNIPLQYEMEKAIYNLGYGENKGRYLDILYRALEQGDMDSYAHIRADLMDRMGLDGQKIDSGLASRYKEHLKQDKNYSLPQQRMDLIGAREREETEKEDTFGEDDLTAGQHEAFARQRSETYRDILDGAQQSAAYGSLDGEGRNALESAAWSYAEQTALENNSGGQYTVDTKWMLNAREAREKYRIPESTFLALRAQVSGIRSLTDKDGERIKDTKGLQIILAVYDVPGLTDKQRQALYEYLGVGKSIRNMNKAAARAKLERLRKKSGN